MAYVSVLTPAFTLPSTDPDIVKTSCAGQLGIETSHLDLFALVPATEAPGHTGEYALKLSKSDLTLQSIEELLRKNQLLNEQVARTKEALIAYSDQFERKQPAQDDTTARKLKKLNHLEADNKKLRQLLKSQLESSENLRQETQHTVETLREEFELLVKELVMFKKKEENVEIPDASTNLQEIPTQKQGPKSIPRLNLHK